MQQYRLYYDGECPFCRWSLRLVLKLDRNRRLEPVALQDEEATRTLSHLSEGERMGSWHLVSPDGRIWSAGDAVEPLARLLRGGAPVAALAGSFPNATRRLYSWVSRHRGTFARLGARV